MKKQQFRFANIVWCKFPAGDQAISPEFKGEHPAIIVSTMQRDGLPFLVIPMSSKAQKGDDPSVIYWHRSPLNPNMASWVVASHIYAVSHKRLRPAKDLQGRPVKLGKERIEEVKEALAHRLPLAPIDPK